MQSVPAVAELGEQPSTMQGVELRGGILDAAAGQGRGGVALDRRSRVPAKATEEAAAGLGRVPVRQSNAAATLSSSAARVSMLVLVSWVRSARVQDGCRSNTRAGSEIASGKEKGSRISSAAAASGPPAARGASRQHLPGLVWTQDVQQDRNRGPGQVPRWPAGDQDQAAPGRAAAGPPDRCRRRCRARAEPAAPAIRSPQTVIPQVIGQVPASTPVAVRSPASAACGRAGPAPGCGRRGR